MDENSEITDLSEKQLILLEEAIRQLNLLLSDLYFER